MRLRLGAGRVADAADVRRLALGLPHVVEIDSDGFDFRVGNHGFVWSYPERIPGQRRVIRTDVAVLYVGDEAEKQALLLGEPDTFFTTPSYDGLPLVMLWLARVDRDRLAELVTDAWRMRAPDALARELEPWPSSGRYRRRWRPGRGTSAATRYRRSRPGSTAGRGSPPPVPPGRSSVRRSGAARSARARCRRVRSGGWSAARRRTPSTRRSRPAGR